MLRLGISFVGFLLSGLYGRIDVVLYPRTTRCIYLEFHWLNACSTVQNVIARHTTLFAEE